MTTSVTTTTSRKRAPSSAVSRSYTKRSRAVTRMPYRYTSPEMKFLDTAYAGVAASTTPSIVLINGMTLGNTAITRVGSNISVMSIEARLRWTTTTGTPCHVRWALFLDTQTNGALPAITDVLTGPDPTAQRNLYNRKRFKCLISKDFNMGGATTGDAPMLHPEHVYLKIKRPIKVEYTSTNNGDVTDITSNSLISIMDSTIASASNPPACSGSIRIRFRDN